MPFNDLESPYLKDLTLLCVDDSLTIQVIYKSIFSSLFKKVLIASDGEEALALYKEADIVISDYQMPKMNGLEMIEAIRKDEQNIPIILVTAFEDISILRDAIQLGVTNFVKKPFEAKDLYPPIHNAIELVMGHKYLLEEKQKQIIELEEKERYSNYQEELSFQKELSMIRNDFYYRLSAEETVDKLYLADFFYKPFDTMSGDLYSARQLNNGTELYFIVDGMGKGISASVSAILFTAYVNYIIDRVMKQGNTCDFQRLVDTSIDYMREHLMDEEVLAVSFVLIDSHNLAMHYSAFGMPSLLLMDKEFEIIALGSNNPPICPYTQKARIKEYKLNNIVKILIASDGIYENSVKDRPETYAEYIEEDFKNAISREDFFSRTQDKIGQQEDDMTFIFLHQLDLSNKISSKSIAARFDEVQKLNGWYEEQFSRLTQSIMIQTKASLACTELLMNSYEHASLGITNVHKHKLMEDDKYLDYLREKEQEVDKNIDISLYKIVNPLNETYVLTKITDESEGFDTDIFLEVFGFHKHYNGRGVFIARQSSQGIYYNNSGNTVYFLHKL